MECQVSRTRTDTTGLLHLTVSIEPKGYRSRDLLDGMSSVEIYELFCDDKGFCICDELSD